MVPKSKRTGVRPLGQGAYDKYDAFKCTFSIMSGALHMIVSCHQLLFHCSRSKVVFKKLMYEHQIHHVDLYICPGTGSIESDTHNSLRQYPNMQSRDDVVICIHRSPYGYTSAHAHPVLVMTWKVER